MKRITWQSYSALLYRRRYAVLATAGLLLALSLWAAAGIEIETRIQDLLPEDNPMVESYDAVSQSFSTSSILLTVEDGDREEMKRAARSLAARIEGDPSLAGDIRSVRVKIDRRFAVETGLLLLDDEERQDLRTVTEDPRLLPFLNAFNDDLEAAWLDEGGEEVSSPSEEREILSMFNQMENFALEMRRWLEKEARDGNRVPDREPEDRDSKTREAAAGMVDSMLIGDRYLFSPDYSMLLIQVSPRFSLTERSRLFRVVETIRAHTAAMEAQYPGMSFGVAGDIVQEADEEAALGFDTVYPALAALLLIFILFYIGLHSLRSVLFALTALAAGIMADIGLIGLTVGELNMVTSSFGALLVGLGIDFGIHLISRFGDELQRDGDREGAMARTLAVAGRPVAVGAVTTALAFYALCFSATKAFVQFGFVAGSGVLLVAAAMFTVLPALLLAFGKAVAGSQRLSAVRAPLAAWGRRAAGRLGRAALAGGFLLTALAALLLPRLSFNYDIRDIGPQETPSKRTEARIIEAFELTPFPSFLMLESLEQTRAVTDALREEDTVSMVNSPADFLPARNVQRERLRALADWHRSLEASPPLEHSSLSRSELEELAYEVQRLEWNIIEIADISAMSMGEENRIIEKRDAMIREIRGAETGEPGRESFRRLIAAIERPGALRRLRALDRAFAAELHDRLLSMTARREPVGPRDLPEPLRREMVSPGGDAYLITVYPTDEIESEAGMFRFEEAMRQVDRRITGTIQLSLVLARQIIREAKNASLAVTAVVILLLLATFRRLSAVLPALVNLAVSVLWMLGLYSLFGRINIVNALAVPLIFGIGIDYSVHVIHGFQREAGAKAVLERAGKAILLSGLTTIIGFGSLAVLGSFHGIATLGALLALGTGMTLLASLVLLPAALVRLKSISPSRQEVSNEI